VLFAFKRHGESLRDKRAREIKGAVRLEHRNAWRQGQGFADRALESARALGDEEDALA